MAAEGVRARPTSSHFVPPPPPSSIVATVPPLPIHRYRRPRRAAPPSPSASPPSTHMASISVRGPPPAALRPASQGTVVFDVQMACGGCSGACTRILKKMDGTATPPTHPVRPVICAY